MLYTHQITQETSIRTIQLYNHVYVRIILYHVSKFVHGQSETIHLMVFIVVVNVVLV